jgi:hypothetical protein
MGTPQNGGDLVQNVAALNWMRSSLPLFAEKAAPLQDQLEVVYQEAKGRTKKKATSVSLEKSGRRHVRRPSDSYRKTY